MAKGEDVIRPVGAKAEGAVDADDEENRQAQADFLRVLNSSTKTAIPVRSLDGETLLEGVALLKKADSASRAAIISGGQRALVFFELPGNLRAGEIDLRRLTVIYYGWDLTFGGSFTVSVGYPPAGTLGRLFVAGDDPALDDLASGRFVLVFVKNGTPALAAEVDARVSEEARFAFDENVRCAATHPSRARDRGASFWEASGAIAGEGSSLKPAELLSVGWAKRYGDAVFRLAKLIEIFKRECTWPEQATLPAPWGCWAALFGGEEPFTADTVLGLVKEAHAAGLGALMALRSAAWHDALHVVTKDHTPLCDIGMAAVSAYLLSSEQTLCGRRVPRLDLAGIGYHSVDATTFAPADALSYWKRLMLLPAEWCVPVRPTDLPSALTVGSPLCQFAGSWGQLKPFFAGSWGHPFAA